jgi:hypothetical protein
MVQPQQVVNKPIPSLFAGDIGGTIIDSFCFSINLLNEASKMALLMGSFASNTISGKDGRREK